MQTNRVATEDELFERKLAERKYREETTLIVDLNKFFVITVVSYVFILSRSWGWMAKDDDRRETILAYAIGYLLFAAALIVAKFVQGEYLGSTWLRLASVVSHLLITFHLYYLYSDLGESVFMVVMPTCVCIFMATLRSILKPKHD